MRARTGAPLFLFEFAADLTFAVREMENSHLIVHFSGRVQGVGFRYQVRETAKGFNVTGYVKNLADGRVLMEAEGETDEVDAFLAEVRDRMSAFIRNTEVKKTSDPQGFSDFNIR